MKKIKLLSLRLKEKFNNLNIYLKYSIIFLFIMIIGLLPIEIKNGSFLFSGLFVSRDAGIDGLKQHLVFMIDFISHIKEGLFSGGISLFRYDIGLGSDFINHYTYYSLFDPLLIVAYLIPLKYVEVSFYVLIILRLYLTGIASVWLSKKIGICTDKGLLVVSITYIFSIALLFSAFRHPMFINGPMYLALIFFGYEKIKKKESPIVLILSVFFALVSQFYMFIYITFGFVLFILIDLIKEFRKEKIKDFIRINLYYLLGVMLGGFVLLTQIYATFNGARVGSKGFELYQAIDYAAIIITNFLPAAGNHYTAGIGNFFVFIICIYFIFNEKKKSNYSLFFIILFALGFSALFSYFINLFSYVVNRWMFLICLPASIIAGKFIENIEEIDCISAKKSLRLIYVIFISGIYCLLSYGLTLITANKIIIIVMGISLFVVALFVCFLVYKRDVNVRTLIRILSSKNLYKYVIYNSLFIVLIVSGIYCFILSPKDALNTYYQDNNLYSDVLETDVFFRVEQDTYVGGVKGFSNDGIYYGYGSTASYNSITNGRILEFIADYNIVNTNNSVGYNGLNGRSRLLAINHVQYIIIRESDKITPPYGFSYYDFINVPRYNDELMMYHRDGNFLLDNNGDVVLEKANIYINTLYLNFGVIYDKYLTYDDISSLSSVEKEMLLTKAIIIDEENENVSKYSEDISINKKAVNDYQLTNIEVKGNEFKVLEQGNIKIKIPKVQKQEVFIEVNGIQSVDYKKSYTTTYSTYNYMKIVDNYGYTSNMHIENKNHLVNLGFYELENDLEIRIDFEEGIYSIEDICYYLVDASNLDLEIDSLNTNALSEVDYINSRIIGKINTSTSGFMFLSIPYSDGFRAYIDGEEVDLFRANTGYMAVYVQVGDETLEIRYFTPGLEKGLYISAISLVIFILIIRFELVNKISRKNQTNKKEEDNEKDSRFY